jgi:hypothetical protein
MKLECLKKKKIKILEGYFTILLDKYQLSGNIIIMIIDEIRKQIENCEKSRYQISKDTGIDQAALCRIMQGKHCTTETADILFKYFGIELVEKKAKRKGR